jgi:FMN-dependent NADH-azoreductase
MHNFGVPSVLKLWIDQIARVGKTFSYGSGGPVGLLTGKKATILIASGGKYDAGSAMASWNFVEPYLRTVFGFLGVSDVTVLAAGGASALASGKVDRESFFQPHVNSIRAQFEAA